MSTMKERLEMTMKVLDDQVTAVETLIHLYYFFQFERLIVKRNRVHIKAAKFERKLAYNIEVYTFRKQMSDHP